MPFVTEEIWQRFPGTRDSIMLSKFPEASEFAADEASQMEMDLLMGVINGVRNIRGEMNIAPSKQVSIVMEVPEERDRDVISRNIVHIQNLARVDSVNVEPRISKPDASATAVFGHIQIHVLLKGLIDFDDEKRRLRKQISAIEKDLETSNKKLSNRQFTEKAPPEIVDKVKGKVDGLGLKLEKLKQNLAFFESLEG
jgi:valyl-tRNA synthetase